MKQSDSSVKPDNERFSNGEQDQKLRRCFKSEKSYANIFAKKKTTYAANVLVSTWL